MKKVMFFLLGLALFSAFKLADDIIAKLGLQHDYAQQNILSNVTGSFNNSFEQSDYDDSQENTDNLNPVILQGGDFKIPYTKMLPSILKGDKAGAAKELCDYIKMYCNSDNFIKDYNAKREKCKPTSEPQQVDAETLQMTKESVKSLETELAKMKKNPAANKQVIPVYETQLSDQKKMLAAWEDPTPNKTKWEKRFPSDPAVIIKKRLEEYLAIAATVDFNAQLTTNNYNQKKFTNPVYEGKSPKWKACFRAGKEVNDVVTAFAKDWLKGDIISSTKTKMPVIEKEKTSNNNTVEKQNNTDTPAINKEQPVKEKKSLFNKIKSKAKGVINK